MIAAIDGARTRFVRFMAFVYFVARLAPTRHTFSESALQN